MLFGNQRFYYPHGSLCLIIVKQHRFGYALPCLVHIFHCYSCGIHMRHIIAALNISSLFECCQRRFYPRFNIVHRVVPTSLARYLESRAANTHALSGHILHGLPYLLYLTDAQFGLVEQYEMLVEVAIAIEHKASCLQVWVAPGSSCLLHIILKRV